MTDHTADLKAIHDAVAALGGLNLAGMSHDDWLETIRGVRQKVQDFAMFVPNADRIEHMLQTAEAGLLAWQAFLRIAQAKDLANGIAQAAHQQAGK